MKKLLCLLSLISGFSYSDIVKSNLSLISNVFYGDLKLSNDRINAFDSFIKLYCELKTLSPECGQININFYIDSNNIEPVYLTSRYWDSYNKRFIGTISYGIYKITYINQIPYYNFIIYNGVDNPLLNFHCVINLPTDEANLEMSIDLQKDSYFAIGKFAFKYYNKNDNSKNIEFKWIENGTCYQHSI